MSHKTILYLAILFGVISCSQEEKTSRGYAFTHHIANGGSTPQVGEYAYFDIVMRHGDSVLNTSAQMLERDKPRLQIPSPEAVNANTPPIMDGLLLMSIGDSLTLEFPLDCLEVIPPAFQNIDKIDYDLKLLDIKTPDVYAAEMEERKKEREEKRIKVVERAPEVKELVSQTLKDYKANKLELTKTPDGLEYYVHEAGEGRKPMEGEYVAVQYYGVLEDGKMFDNSFVEGDPYSFQIGMGRVIQGWDKGIALLPKGTKATLFIPYELGYGEAGYQDIPERANLIFYVELEP